MRSKCVVFVAVAAVLLCGMAAAQTVSSFLVGTVTDPGNAVIPGVDVKLVDQSTGQERSARANEAGLFRFNDLAPGRYSVTIRADGFKGYQQRDINISSSEARDLGRVVLEIGSLTDEVHVTAEATPVQLASSEKSALIDGAEILDVAIKGRDLFDFMRTLPGVVDTRATRDVTSPNSIAGITINGGSANQKNFTVDGVTDMDTGSNGTLHYEPNLDAIAEIRVLSSNYQAEYGRNASGLISVVTKSGTQDFHGSAWWTHRHEQFNANDFFRNKNGLSRVPYRYNVAGFSMGGPIFIPSKFNSDKRKLFFFASQEYTRQMEDQGTRYTNMPTALERIGDFSKSFDSNGKLITIKDPVTGQAFQGNIIPPSRIDKIGQAILNFFPLPNYADPDPTQVYNRNYKAQASSPHPRRNDVVRIDTFLGSKFNANFRFIHDADELDSVFQGLNWIYAIQNHPNPGKGYAVNASYSFSPTLIDQFTFGKSWNTWAWFMKNEGDVSRDKMGNPPKWYPLDSSRPDLYRAYIPNVSFGNTPVNSAGYTLGNPPYANFNDIYSYADNLTKAWSSHNLKAGIYIEHNGKQQASNTNYRGVYNFGRDTNNPLDSGNGYANALLGNFTSYQEATRRNLFNVWYWNVEWYAQDNWRVSRRLTLDYGIRFYQMPAQVDLNNTFATFDVSAYSRQKAPRLYVPGFDASRRRVAVDPVTGATAPAPLIGLFVPGSGDPANGMKRQGDGVPFSIYSTPFIKVAPRAGFAWDLFGNGKTALRGGFGLFFNREDGNQVYNMSGNPPVSYTPQLSYGSIGTLTDTNGLTGPTNINYYFGRIQEPHTWNWSFGVQQSVGFGTLLDVAYVGSAAADQSLRYNINAIPRFARFDPNNADPTQAGKPLPDNFLRPYTGLGDVNPAFFLGYSNYHSLQISGRRRLTKGVMFGGSYTWSRNLGVTSTSPYFDSPKELSKRNYGLLTTDRSHSLSVNYSYEVPKLGKRLDNRFIGAITDNWLLSGITSFSTGAPFTPTFTTTDGADISGSTEGARIDVIGDASLARGEKTFARNFKTEMFRRPAVGTFGTAGVNILRGPGVNNWDATLTKSIPVPLGERGTVKLRSEFYNLFNHTQFSGIDTAARFDASGTQVNANFGTYNASRSPRIISFALRLEF